MKIEKISDTQIRCTLTGDDLDSMNIKLTDLILKKDKSRALFEDILETALAEFNFKPGEAPMMIEAMPGDDNSVVLTFTVVDGKTTSSLPLSSLLGGNDANTNTTPAFDGLVGSENTTVSAGISSSNSDDKISTKGSNTASNIFSFKTMDEVIDIIPVIKNDFNGKSNLHLDHANKLFILSLFQCDSEYDSYYKVCNTLCEFGVLEICNTLSLAYLNEYCQPIVLNNAVELLGQI